MHPASRPAELPEGRPSLNADLSGAELRRWYWLKAELVALARTLGVRTSGGKQVLTARIAAALDGVPFTEPTRTSRAGSQLSGPMDVSTLVPRGQRCSQAIRAWFSAELESPFRFDARMRDWFAEADGTHTLGDALAHHLARGAEEPRPEIGKQFEYNRFARAWFDEHPDGDAVGMRAAWHSYRALPRPLEEVF